jgi:cold shock CspA family protein/ribosome-associated translation inhibitor RaiA
MQLPVQITFRNMRHIDAIEKEIREKVSALERYYDRIMACRVMVEVPHRHHVTGTHYHVRIDLTVPGTEIVVNREPSMRSSLRSVEEERSSKSTELDPPHKHLRVTIREAFDVARRQLQDFARRQRMQNKNQSGEPGGRIISLFRDKGYGFVATSDGREVYFHKNSVLDGDLNRLELGMPVEFVEEAGERGPQITSLRIAGRIERRAPVPV